MILGGVRWFGGTLTDRAGGSLGELSGGLGGF